MRARPSADKILPETAQPGWLTWCGDQYASRWCRPCDARGLRPPRLTMISSSVAVRMGGYSDGCCLRRTVSSWLGSRAECWTTACLVSITLWSIHGSVLVVPSLRRQRHNERDSRKVHEMRTLPPQQRTQWYTQWGLPSPHTMRYPPSLKHLHHHLQQRTLRPMARPLLSHHNPRARPRVWHCTLSILRVHNAGQHVFLTKYTRQSPYLCPVDLMKVIHGAKTKAEQHYLALHSFCDQHVMVHLFSTLQAWIRARMGITMLSAPS